MYTRSRWFCYVYVSELKLLLSGTDNEVQFLQINAVTGRMEDEKLRQDMW